MRLFTGKLAFVRGDMSEKQTGRWPHALPAEVPIAKLVECRHPSANCRVILASCSDIVYVARSERTDMYETANFA